MKNQLKSSIIFFCLGIAFLILAFIFPSISIFVGFVGGCFGPAVMMLYKYLYWRKRPEEYEEKIKNDTIELHDERKEMIRGKALRVSTLVNWCLLSIFIVTIAFLGQFEIIASEISRYIVMGIAGYWLISIAIMQIIYKWLSKKY